jgi:hypothetical protein
MKKCFLTLIALTITLISFTQTTYAYTDSYQFFVFNGKTDNWDFVNAEKEWARFVFASNDYFLIETSEDVSKYDVLKSEVIKEQTIYTVKESGGKIYYFSMSTDNIYFINQDQDGSMFQVNFKIYLWESK